MSGLDAPRIRVVGAGAIGGVLGAALTRHGEGEFFLGELDGSRTARCERVQRLLALVAPTTIVDNVWGWLWTKQVYGCLLVASALADEPIGEQLAVPAVRLVHAALLCEA